MQKTVVEIEKASHVLKLLGDKTRLTIMAILKQRECCVCELLEVRDTEGVDVVHLLEHCVPEDPREQREAQVLAPGEAALRPNWRLEWNPLDLQAEVPRHERRHFGTDAGCVERPFDPFDREHHRAQRG